MKIYLATDFLQNQAYSLTEAQVTTRLISFAFLQTATKTAFARMIRYGTIGDYQSSTKVDRSKVQK